MRKQGRRRIGRAAANAARNRQMLFDLNHQSLVELLKFF